MERTGSSASIGSMVWQWWCVCVEGGYGSGGVCVCGGESMAVVMCVCGGGYGGGGVKGGGMAVGV